MVKEEHSQQKIPCDPIPFTPVTHNREITETAVD